MKTVYIVRHAKSSWDNFNLADHDRPLMPIGIKKTKKVIKFFNTKNIFADIIISSTAVRAVETAKLIAKGIGFDNDLILRNKALYHADVDDIYAELFAINNDVNFAIIVAHNPTLTDFVNDFVNPKIDNLSTSGVVSIEFKTDSWEKIANTKFKVNFVVFPRMLP